MTGRLILGLALAATCSSAAAQHYLVLQKLEELNAKAPQPATSELQSAVAKTAREFAAANKTCEPSSVKVSEIVPITGARGIFQATMAGQLRNAWTLYADHVGCASANPIRYLVVQKADGTLNAMQVNEGRSYANPTLMRDTSAGAAVSALQKAKSLDASCTGDSLKMLSTRVTGQSADLGPEVFGARYVGNWDEVWQFKVCGRRIDVPVHFIPDGDGGAYTHIISEKIAVLP